jgi:hypothetical protein
LRTKLVILMDDAGYGSNSMFGGIVPTPTLEKLAQAGPALYADAQHRAVFTDARGAAHRTQPPRGRLFPQAREMVKVVAWQSQRAVMIHRTTR